jgi:hypothetical protein
MPDRYTLASQFVDPVLERTVLAAIAARPVEAGAVVARLTPELFPETQALYEAVIIGELFVSFGESHLAVLHLTDFTVHSPCSERPFRSHVHQKRSIFIQPLVCMARRRVVHFTPSTMSLKATMTQHP